MATANNLPELDGEITLGGLPQPRCDNQFCSPLAHKARQRVNDPKSESIAAFRTSDLRRHDQRWGAKRSAGTAGGNGGLCPIVRRQRPFRSVLTLGRSRRDFRLGKFRADQASRARQSDTEFALKRVSGSPAFNDSIVPFAQFFAFGDCDHRIAKVQ